MKTKDIRTMAVNEIDSKLVELKDKLFKQKFQKTLGQAESPYKIRQTKRDIAKLMTILTEMRSQNGKNAKKS
ncbi:MAG: 50S ribosomal protein L29 [Candidatus Aminicenantes bacterium]|nr:50S ribosomal protein L29 [Acidobacteriota bacterium]MCG2810604.1 50S ribosomal protein L29 [Candidatus Aminicenantes bacterium]